MISSITQCPECNTRFRVTAEQLAAHEGMVRCGRCNSVFKATEHLHEDAAQLSAPVLQVEHKESQKESLLEVLDDSAAGLVHFVAAHTDTDELETLLQQVVIADEFPLDELPADEAYAPVPKQRQWPWIAGSLLLLLVILAQALYYYRIDIASRLPGLKPALTTYCELLRCAISLPEKVELLSIESSDLQADPAQQNVVTFSALLHNRAEFAQAYPSLELSLTDSEEQVLARRVFTPAEYLHARDNEKTGLGANRELSIQLHLDSSDLRPLGYKLLLYFPPKRS